MFMLWSTLIQDDVLAYYFFKNVTVCKVYYAVFAWNINKNNQSINQLNSIHKEQRSISFVGAHSLCDVEQWFFVLYLPYVCTICMQVWKMPINLWANQGQGSISLTLGGIQLDAILMFIYTHITRGWMNCSSSDKVSIMIGASLWSTFFLTSHYEG